MMWLYFPSQKKKKNFICSLKVKNKLCKQNASFNNCHYKQSESVFSSLTTKAHIHHTHVHFLICKSAVKEDCASAQARTGYTNGAERE